MPISVPNTMLNAMLTAESQIVCRPARSRYCQLSVITCMTLLGEPHATLECAHEERDDAVDDEIVAGDSQESERRERGLLCERAPEERQLGDRDRRSNRGVLDDLHELAADRR